MTFRNVSFRTRSDILEVAPDGVWLEKCGHVSFQFFRDYLDFNDASVAEIYNLTKLCALLSEDIAIPVLPDDDGPSHLTLVTNLANQTFE